MQERRTYIRFQVPVLVEFPNPETMKTERSFTYDVSESGLRFPTAVKLQAGQEVPLALQLPFHDAPFHATGLVMWIREVARLGATQYEVGLRFRWMDDPDRQKLMRYFEGLVTSRL